MRGFAVLLVLPAVVLAQGSPHADVPTLKGATYIGESGGSWAWVVAQPNGSPVVALKGSLNQVTTESRPDPAPLAGRRANPGANGTGPLLLSFGPTLAQPGFAYSMRLRVAQLMGLKSDAQGRIHVLGAANSLEDLPGMTNQFGCKTQGGNTFVAQINASTRAIEYIDCIHAMPRSIAVDAAGATYILVVAHLASSFPRVGGLTDAPGPAALIKYNTSGKVQFSTLLYGSPGQMGVDAGGAVYVAGSEISQMEKMAGVSRAGCGQAARGNGPFTAIATGGRSTTARPANGQPACEGSIQKISPNGDQVLATVLVPTQSSRLAVAPDGTSALLGRSLTCLNPDGSLRFSSDPIYPGALAFEFGPNQDLYITTRNAAASFPLVHSLGQPEPAGRSQGNRPLLTRVSGRDGRIVYSTLLGPASSLALLTSLAFGAGNTVYVAGYGAGMPVMARPYKHFAPGTDAFLLQIEEKRAADTPPACEYGTSPPVVRFPRHGGAATVVIYASRGDCPSDFQSDQKWLRVAGPTSGTGIRTLTLQADANVEQDARQVVIRSGQLQVPIEQAGATSR